MSNEKGTIVYYHNDRGYLGDLGHCAARKFDLTEPMEIELHTEYNDQYAPAGVRVFMNDSYTYFSTGKIPDMLIGPADIWFKTKAWFSKANNNEPYEIQHFNLKGQEMLTREEKVKNQEGLIGGFLGMYSGQQPNDI